MPVDFLKRAALLETQLLDWRRTLHSCPELGFDLPQTTDFVWRQLCAMGYQPKRVGRAGITACVGGPGPVFLLRGDMDALPLREESGLPFAAKNGSCHACGHDLHTTALLGAARLLKEAEPTLRGTVKLMFQPCEERMEGAQDMILHGLLEDPAPQAGLALHVANAPLGSVGIRRGYAGASCDMFKITVQGRGCHGAAAYLGVDPILTAAHLVTALQALNSREVAPDQMLVLTVCMLQGGDAPNIIPETCQLQGSIRTASQEVRSFARERLTQIAGGVASTFRASCTVEFGGSGVPPMVNDPALAGELSRYADSLLGEGTAYEIEAMTGSEDFSQLCSHIPCVLAWFGAGNAEEGCPYGIHHPKVMFREEAIHRMSALYAHCAAQWLAARG